MNGQTAETESVHVQTIALMLLRLENAHMHTRVVITVVETVSRGPRKTTPQGRAGTPQN